VKDFSQFSFLCGLDCIGLCSVLRPHQHSIQNTAQVIWETGLSYIVIVNAEYWKLVVNILMFVPQFHIFAYHVKAWQINGM